MGIFAMEIEGYVEFTWKIVRKVLNVDLNCYQWQCLITYIQYTYFAETFFELQGVFLSGPPLNLLSVCR